MYDTKGYDWENFDRAEGAGEIAWEYHEFRLNAQTAPTAAGKRAVCVFVNDRIDAACLAALAEHGVRHLALRCAGFNNVELLQGLPRRLTTMDACRREIGQAAAGLIRARLDEGGAAEKGRVIELSPTVSMGDTLKRKG